MNILAVERGGPLAIDMNQPGSFLHWSIFTVSVANLVLIAVMVVIFGAALLIPFPGRREEPAAPPIPRTAPRQRPADAGRADDGTRAMWTARLRRRALRLLPPGKLLPDRQPAYVASWVYVFGVATLAALGVAIVSGFALALGGPDWWHTNSVGHFFNSLHLWSVELFMALMVIHLWGKFWMAAWRGRRALTWITGVVAFVASVVECFTGYLSQQNFDSQWISTSGKDAFNAVGVGAFFNVMNFGQMLMWHIVLLPIVLVAIVGAHVLLVRVRGVVAPDRRACRRGRGHGAAAAARHRSGRRRSLARPEPALRHPEGRHHRRGDRAGAHPGPGRRALLARRPAGHGRHLGRVAPADFLATAATELDGTSETATYGPPYNNQPAAPRGCCSPRQTIAGVTQPVDAAQDFVLAPLSDARRTDPAIAAPLATYRAAPAAQQQKWATAYDNAVTKVKFVNGSPVGRPPPRRAGPGACWPASSPWPAAARWTPTCWPSSRSTAPTTPSRCCSSRTATTSPTRPRRCA